MGARYQALMKYEAIGVHVIMRAYMAEKGLQSIGPTELISIMHLGLA